LQLDGSGDYGTKSGLWLAYDTFQIDLWMRADESVSERYLIDVPNVLHLRLKNNSIWMDVNRSGGTWVNCHLSSQFIENGQLEHIRATCSNNVIRLIRADGTMDEEAFSGVPVQATNTLYAGAQGGTNLFFSGILDEVRIQAQ
jgi:hypothetical protein